MKIRIKTKAISFISGFMAVVSFLANAEQRVWTTNPETSNTPATAYDWNDRSNWKNELIPNDYDGATFNIPSAFYYVKIPETVIVTNLNIKTKNGKYACLIGGKIIVTTSLPTRGNLVFGGAYFFGDIETGPEPSPGFSFPYISGVELAGKAIAIKQNWVPSSGWVDHRLDKFAYSSNPLRTDDIVIADDKAYNPGNASTGIYAPQGNDGAFNKKWNLVKDSPYITRHSSQEAHPIAAGTIVSGEGLAEGTFVKRIFNNGYIELSQNATLSVDGALLDFAPFTPEVRINIKLFSRMGDGATSLSLYKYRPEDILVFEPTKITGYSPQVWNIGLTSTQINSYSPGTLALHEISFTGTHILHNSHINIKGNGDKPTEYTKGAKVQIAESCTARITVDENVTGIINTFTNVLGTLVKDGEGVLKTCFAETENTNASIVVESGTLNLTKSQYALEGPVKIAKLEIKAGAVLEIPQEGLSVGELKAEAGAIVRGPGNLDVTCFGASDIKNIVFENSATHVIKVGNPGSYVSKLPEGEVVGHPVFWVDASRPDTIEVTTTTEGDETVTKFKWKDCREGEPMFCTNIFYAPLYVNGETMAEKYVNIRRRQTSTNALTEALVWSVPVGDIKAVFLVQDPRDGGGEILGRTARLDDSYFGTQGGPYYRGDSSNWQKHLISPAYATPCVKFGRFYIDGQEICGYEKGYLRTGLQVIEHHVNDNEYANLNNKRKGLWIDAFGVGYKDKNSNGMGKNGCMRIAEYIIYTNSLSHAERLKVSQYLSRKWLGKDVYWTVTEDDLKDRINDFEALGQTIEVPQNTSYAIMSLSGDGKIYKEGAGELFVGNVTNADITVSGGKLVVRSLAVTNSFVPQNSWVHVDATEPSMMETNVIDGVTYVSKWRSLGNSTLAYVPWAVLKEDGTYARGPYSPTMLRSNAINSLPAIDLGPLYYPGNHTPAKRALRIIKEDGTFYNKFNAGPYLDAPILKTVFVVADTSQGGNALLGADMDGYPAVGFAHQYTLDFSSPIISCDAHTWGHSAYSNYFNQGTAMFRTNGVPINANVVPYSGNADVFTYHSNQYGPRSDSLGIYAYEEAVNGMMFGEVLLYEEALSSNALFAVEAYLRMKWRNERTPGYEIARMSSLLLKNGAEVSTCGWGLSESDPCGYLLTQALGGWGSITGDVRLESNASIIVDVLEDGTPGCVEIEGSADFSKGGNVVFAGNIASLKVGIYEIVKSDNLNFGGEWACESPLKNRTASLHYKNNILYLNVNRSATILILR